MSEVEEDITSDEFNIHTFLQSHGVDSSGIGEHKLVPVPRHPPFTRKQYDEWRQYWPCVFHEDKQYVHNTSLK